MATDAERLATLEAQMKVALEGVSNFRTFQARASQFFDRYEARVQERENEEKKEAIRKAEEEKRREAKEKADQQKIDRFMNRLYRTLLIIALIYGGLQVFANWVGPTVRQFLHISQIQVHTPTQMSGNPSPYQQQ